MKHLLIICLAILVGTHAGFGSFSVKDNGEIYIFLEARDFKGNIYMDPDDCAMARAVKRQFKTSNVLVGGDNVDIGDGYYTFTDFNFFDFDNDQRLAADAPPEKILQKVKIFKTH